MQYIITRTDVELNCDILDLCTSKSDAIFKIHNHYCCDVNKTKLYVKRKNNQTYIEEYCFNKGYLWNSKTLKFVYKINEYQPPSAFKKELDQAIKKRTKK